MPHAAREPTAFLSLCQSTSFQIQQGRCSVTVAELPEGIVDDAGGSPSVSVAELLEVRGSSSLLRKSKPGQPGTGRPCPPCLSCREPLTPGSAPIFCCQLALAAGSLVACGLHARAINQFALTFGPLIDIAPVARAARVTASCYGCQLTFGHRRRAVWHRNCPEVLAVLATWWATPIWILSGNANLDSSLADGMNCLSIWI